MSKTYKEKKETETEFQKCVEFLGLSGVMSKAKHDAVQHNYYTHGETLHFKNSNVWMINNAFCVFTFTLTYLLLALFRNMVFLFAKVLAFPKAFRSRKTKLSDSKVLFDEAVTEFKRVSCESPTTAYSDIENTPKHKRCRMTAKYFALIYQYHKEVAKLDKVTNVVDKKSKLKKLKSMHSYLIKHYSELLHVIYKLEDDSKKPQHCISVGVNQYEAKDSKEFTDELSINERYDLSNRNYSGKTSSTVHIPTLIFDPNRKLQLIGEGGGAFHCSAILNASPSVKERSIETSSFFSNLGNSIVETGKGTSRILENVGDNVVDNGKTTINDGSDIFNIGFKNFKNVSVVKSLAATNFFT
jgi:hypothetical protein